MRGKDEVVRATVAGGLAPLGEREKELQQRLDEQAEEILALKKQLADRESGAIRAREEQIKDLKERLKEEEKVRKDCQEALWQTESKLKALSSASGGRIFPLFGKVHRPLGPEVTGGSTPLAGGFYRSLAQNSLARTRGGHFQGAFGRSR